MKPSFVHILRRMASTIVGDAVMKKVVLSKPDLLERDVKKRVKEIVALIDPTAHIFMPVQNGFGKQDLDFRITIAGNALIVETKRNGAAPSPAQAITIAELVKAGGVVLVIDENNLIDLALTAVFLKESAVLAARMIANDSREIYLER